MATKMTTTLLRSIFKGFGLPATQDAWVAAGRPESTNVARHLRPMVTVRDGGELRYGVILWVTDDEWAGVRIDGERTVHEWPVGSLVVD